MKNTTYRIGLLLSGLLLPLLGLSTASAYDISDLSTAMDNARETASWIRIIGNAATECASQLNNGDRSNLDICMNVINTIHGKLGEAMTQVKPDIQNILGLTTP